MSGLLTKGKLAKRPVHIVEILLAQSLIVYM